MIEENTDTIFNIYIYIIQLHDLIYHLASILKQSCSSSYEEVTIMYPFALSFMRILTDYKRMILTPKQ